VDYTLVRELGAEVAERLRAARRARAETGQRLLSDDDERELGRSLIAAAIEDFRRRELAARGGPLPPPEDDRELAEAVYAARFGLGRLQPLINDGTNIAIEITGADRVWLHKTDGQLVAGPAVADSDAELIEWVRTIGAYGGLSSRPFDPVHPWLETRLPDGSRMHALMSVCERPSVSIRLYRLQRITLDELHERGSFSTELLDFFTAAAHGACNLIISGEPFAGKTTQLRALANAIPYHESIITIEHFRELGIEHFPDLHRDVRALEERLPNAEGVGGMSLAELVERSRRMNPDRTLVGEIIGGEVSAMLDAMSQGASSSMSSCHSRDALSVFDRLADYALRGPAHVPVEATGRLIARAIDFVVHMRRVSLPDGRVHRFVESVREVVGWDGTQVVSSEVFATSPGELLAEPAAPITPARAARLAAHGYSPHTQLVRR